MTKLFSVKIDGSFIASFLWELYVIMITSNSCSNIVEKPVLAQVDQTIYKGNLDLSQLSSYLYSFTTTLAKNAYTGKSKGVFTSYSTYAYRKPKQVHTVAGNFEH